jgi:mRNA-degrading endonuclease RelE of RelBE toxin-antitoxin system
LPYITSTYTFVETKQFSRLVGEYLSDDDYASLQRALIANPAAGALIPGTGGVRKIRWAAAGRGKRGGVRVIYYGKIREGVIWMLTIYGKNVADNIPAHILRKIREEMDA